MPSLLSVRVLREVCSVTHVAIPTRACQQARGRRNIESGFHRTIAATQCPIHRIKRLLENKMNLAWIVEPIEIPRPRQASIGRGKYFLTERDETRVLDTIVTSARSVRALVVRIRRQDRCDKRQINRDDSLPTRLQSVGAAECSWRNSRIAARAALGFDTHRDRFKNTTWNAVCEIASRFAG